MEHRIIGVANAIWSDRYRDASAVFAAGSIVRGEGMPHSDLDLVVVYTKLARAYRESFRFEGYPVEAFVHDRETLEYCFFDVDGPNGIPALPQMVVEGVEIPAPNDVSRALKQQAASLIAAGPPALDTESEQRSRYAITDLIDDLRDARPHDELIGTGSRLYEQLADYYLRRQGLWSAKGKAIPRVLRRADPELCTRYCQSFDSLFKIDDASDVIQLAEDLLRAGGGPLFEGYRADAPRTWRKSQREVTPPETIGLARICLRRPRLSDADAIFEFGSDPEVARYGDWAVRATIEPLVESLRERSALWESGAEFYWVITLPEDDRPMGAISCRVAQHAAEFGFILNRRYWNNGYATEASQAIVAWAFSVPSIRRVWATCDTENLASARVLEKAGLSREGTLRRAIVRPNLSSEPRDAFIYSRVR